MGAATLGNLYVIHRAELLDSCPRARNSDVCERLLKGIAEMFKVRSFHLTDVETATPMDKIRGDASPRPLEYIWNRTNWFSSEFLEKLARPDRSNIPIVTADSACEVNQCLFSGQHVLHYLDTISWFDIV